jgi:membrane peptidoglycan carboxypeptidase
LPDDHLTDWAVKYLASVQDRSLKAMLQAALLRKYSGSAGESFFTGGGVHHFENFESWEADRNFTVSEAFQNSVNLAFVRLMRDIVYYYRFRVSGASPAVIRNDDDPARSAYLARFADQEGRVFLWRFYQKYRGQTPDQSLDTLMHGIAYLTPLRAAAIYRSIKPQAGLDEFTKFLKAHLSKVALAKADPANLYDKYGPDKFDLADRGYLAHVHPLELWLLNYREQYPGAKWNEVAAKSAGVRQDVYWWLFKTEHKGAQDNRIWILLEQDAFKEIHKAWKKQGYPFDSLVPSYATTIGVSGDTPAALAELMGILVNDGVRYPAIKIEQLHFGEGTPTETIVGRNIAAGQRVIAPEIASLVRQELNGVVDNGTGRRMQGGIKLANGQAIRVGGKTGTGDNRLESFSAHGHLIGSKVMSRTATFVFMVGDRYYGTVLAFVPGSKAGSYSFTSALAVQVLKDLVPELKPLLEGAPQQQRPVRELVAQNR